MLDAPRVTGSSCATVSNFLVDPQGFKLPGEQWEACIDALADAFPKYAELREMLKFRLDLDLERIAPENARLDQILFDVVKRQKAHGHFLRLIEAARSSRPDNPKLAFFAEGLSLAAITVSAAAPEKAMALEKIVVASRSFVDIASWRHRLGEIEAAVCRVEVTLPTGIAYGTGFLFAADLVLTNHHVVAAAIGGDVPVGNVAVRFDYKTFNGQTSDGTLERVTEIPDHSPHDQVDVEPWPKSRDPQPQNLDYAVLRLGKPPMGKAIGERPIGTSAEPGAPRRGWIQFPDKPWTFNPDTPLFIVQHPDRAPMQLAIESKAIIDVNANGTRVRYRTNTLGGSSGSPCFNEHLELVALHHAGDPNLAQFYQPQYNEGIPIAAVQRLMSSRAPSNA